MRFIHHPLVRVISAVLVVSMLTFDIAWAHPDRFDAHNATLGAPLVSNGVPVTGSAAVRSGVIHDAFAFDGALVTIADYHFGDAGRGIPKLPPEMVEQVLQEEGFTALDTEFDNGIITVFATIGGRERVFKIIQANDPRVNDLPGVEVFRSERYVVREVTEGVEDTSAHPEVGPVPRTGRGDDPVGTRDTAAPAVKAAPASEATLGVAEAPKKPKDPSSTSRGLTTQSFLGVFLAAMLAAGVASAQTAQLGEQSGLGAVWTWMSALHRDEITGLALLTACLVYALAVVSRAIVRKDWRSLTSYAHIPRQSSWLIFIGTSLAAMLAGGAASAQTARPGIDTFYTALHAVTGFVAENLMWLGLAVVIAVPAASLLIYKILTPARHLHLVLSTRIKAEDATRSLMERVLKVLPWSIIGSILIAGCYFGRSLLDSPEAMDGLTLLFFGSAYFLFMPFIFAGIAVLSVPFEVCLLGIAAFFASIWGIAGYLENRWMSSIVQGDDITLLHMLATHLDADDELQRQYALDAFQAVVSRDTDRAVSLLRCRFYSSRSAKNFLIEACHLLPPSRILPVLIDAYKGGHLSPDIFLREAAKVQSADARAYVWLSQLGGIASSKGLDLTALADHLIDMSGLTEDEARGVVGALLAKLDVSSLLINWSAIDCRVLLIDFASKENSRSICDISVEELAAAVKEPAIGWLRAVLDNVDSDKRYLALAALCKLGSPDIEAIIIRSLSDPDQHVRAVATRAFIDREMCDLEAAGPLVAILTQGRSISGTADAARRIGEPVGVQLIEILTKGGDAAVRAASALGGMRYAPAMVPLIKKLSDSSHSMRSAAAGALLHFQDHRLAPLEAYFTVVKDHSEGWYNVLSTEDVDQILAYLSADAEVQAAYRPLEYHDEQDCDSYGAYYGSTPVLEKPAHLTITPYVPSCTESEMRKGKAPAVVHPTQNRLLADFTPDVSFWEFDAHAPSDSVIGETLVGQDEMERILSERNWWWTPSAGGRREEALLRIRYAQTRVLAALGALRKNGVIESGKNPIATYLMGSYPWVESPNDIDMVIIVDGECGLTRIGESDLAMRSVSRLANVDVNFEVIGLETLKRAARGEGFDMAKVIRRKLTVYSSSALLAGVDIFKDAKIPLENFEVMRKDLLADAERANWPDILDASKIEAKKIWRAKEAEAMRAWIEARRAALALAATSPDTTTDARRSAATMRTYARATAHAVESVKTQAMQTIEALDTAVMQHIVGRDRPPAIDAKETVVSVRHSLGARLTLLDRPAELQMPDDTAQVVAAARKVYTELTARSIAASAIALWRRAKREARKDPALANQRPIIAFETGWIPGISEHGRDTERELMDSVLREIRRVTGSDDLRALGIEIICKDGAELAAEIDRVAKASGTNYSNIVIMASHDTLTLDGFRPFVDAPDTARPFITEIDPRELADWYTKWQSDPNHDQDEQLLIRLTEMLAMTLELAVNPDRRPPEGWMSNKYDRARRYLHLQPPAEKKNCELLRVRYKAEATALAAA